MKARYLYSELAIAIQARANCAERMNGQRNSNNGITSDKQAEEWYDRWDDRITRLVSDHMPSGGGFDNGTKLDLDMSHAERLVFHTSYHHMNDGGYYDGWTEHTVTVTPSFSGVNLRVSGRNRNDIKDYIHEVFHYSLTQEVPAE
jgi:hypothetical protein